MFGYVLNNRYTTSMLNLFDELNEKQIKAVKTIKGPVLILAGAGSGKTKTLTHRIAYLISECSVLPRQILAVTFTNKAAAELRNRAAGLLGQDPKAWHVWRGFGFCPALGTFHSICARILREEAEKIGFRQSFVIYDAQDQKQAMKNIMREQGISPKELNPSTILGMISRAKNELLSSSEMDADARGPIEKLASRLYALYQDYFKKNNAMDFDDLLMLCVRLFQKHADVLKKYQNMWQYIMIDEYQDTNHAQYTWACLLAGKLGNIFVVGDDWQGIYSWRGANIRNILEFEKDFKGARVIRLEQNYRSTSPIVELGNLIISGNKGQMKKKLWTEKKSDFLPQVVQVSDEVREAEMILEKINETEAQITKSKTQTNYKIQNPNKHESAFDDEISYDYESEGNEEPGILDKIMSTFSKHDSKSNDFASGMLRMSSGISNIPLDIGQQNINWNNYAVLYRTNAQSRAIEEVLLKYCVPYRLIGGIRFYERKEIKDTLAYLRLLLNPNDGVSLARIINEPSRGIGEKTLARVQQISRERDMSVLSAMSGIENDKQISPARAQAMKNFSLIFERALNQLAQLTVKEIIDLILKRAGYIDMLKALGDEGPSFAKASGGEKERIENIEELKNVAKKFEVLRGKEALEAFLEEVSLVADIDTYDPRSGQALTLMTLHSAKGLEFDTVFLVGLEEGLLPHSNSLIDPEQLEEERRLCYVGITRARERLYIIHTAQRALHGSIVTNTPSRFLSELGNEYVEFFDDARW